jgi:acetylornithine deacetylase/succinyl-diaminopimelate desuccinylase-like protein
VDLHSGLFGGTVPNAAAALVELLARLKDADGRIAIPGWYDDVRELTREERRNLAALPFDAEEFMRTAGVRALPGEQGFSPLERIGGRPAADLNGVWSGYTGEGAKTVIPAEAHAKVSFRLVADQEPGKLEPLFEQWLREQVPEGCELSVRWFGGVGPCLTPIDHPANRAVARAVERAFGAAPLFTREGGSGPERALSDALGGVEAVAAHRLGHGHAGGVAPAQRLGGRQRARQQAAAQRGEPEPAALLLRERRHRHRPDGRQSAPPQRRDGTNPATTPSAPS